MPSIKYATRPNPLSYLARQYGPNNPLDPNAQNTDPTQQALAQLGSGTIGAPQANPSGYAQDLMTRIAGLKGTKPPTSGLTSVTPADAATNLSGSLKGFSSPYQSQLSEITQMGTNATAIQHAKIQYAQQKAAEAAAAAAAKTAAANAKSNAGTIFPNLPTVQAKGARAAIIKFAEKWLGTPYSWGGGGPGGPSYGSAQGANTKGFDCSGLVQYAYSKVGIHLPRVSQDQMRTGVRTSISNLQPGDLVGWGHPAHHIAIYLGGGRIIEAPHTGSYVRIVSLSQKGGGAWGIHVKI